MIDNLDIKFRGEFSIESIKDNEVIETFEDKNLVVDGSRAIISSLLAGVNNPLPINKLSLGTMGHDENFDKFTPKQVDVEYQVGAELVKFDATRTKLFCQDYEENTLDCQWLTVANDDTNQILPLVISYGLSEYETSESQIDVTVTCNSVIFKFEIERGIGHGSGDNSIMSYTEAGLYAENILFATKTFPVKVKDSATKFIITWKIFT
jgi:hypothetical protein